MNKKIRAIENNWLVYQDKDSGNVYVSHFCSGKDEEGKRKTNPWFHRDEDVEKTDKCSSCDEKIPGNIFMLAKIKNVNI